jgi:tetrahydromethanopterin S-methyltransferase subunit E
MTSNQHLGHPFPCLQLYEDVWQVTVHATGESLTVFL